MTTKENKFFVEGDIKGNKESSTEEVNNQSDIADDNSISEHKEKITDTEIKDSISEESLFSSEEDIEDINDDLPYSEKTIVNEPQPFRVSLSNLGRPLEDYEVDGIPDGMNSYSREWMYECELRELAMSTALRRQSMLSGIKSRRGNDFYLKLKDDVERRMGLMRALGINHSKIDEKKARKYLENKQDTDSSSRQDYTFKENRSKPKRKFVF